MVQGAVLPAIQQKIKFLLSKIFSKTWLNKNPSLFFIYIDNLIVEALVHNIDS